MSRRHGPEDSYTPPIAEPPHVLFLCSRNRWRSPTAEKLFSGPADLKVRSRGLARSARRRLTDADVVWADIIFVMEDDHHKRLVREHRDALGETPVHEIPDDYGLMDPDLVEILTAAVTPILAKLRENVKGTAAPRARAGRASSSGPTA